ncbi:MAG TPA: phosphate ABC transporter permease subunit PstC [Spirochaetota bacterium]|nr:phosphate ABC transporter permease subunit PstC [Spirochaetota bacterium]HOL57473.1 phosphate ABC transporter permease subunit PstC [Spirochaetota bacterium]HPP05058.1 phosphate ABC transporter permease subunit PstC [Spirochaetota bacterium]
MKKILNNGYLKDFLKRGSFVFLFVTILLLFTGSNIIYEYKIPFVIYKDIPKKISKNEFDKIYKKLNYENKDILEDSYEELYNNFILRNDLSESDIKDLKKAIFSLNYISFYFISYLYFIFILIVEIFLIIISKLTDKIKDIIFSKILLASGIFLIVLIVVMLITLFISSIPAFKKFGLSFFWNSVWDPINNNFGALPFIVGTIYSSFLALIISLPFSLSIAILLGVYLKKGFFSNFIKSTTELLAGIPSVIYGLWGFLFLVPLMRQGINGVGHMLNIPANSLFFENNKGVGILTSSIVLAIMIIPYTASIGREIIELVPQDLCEAGYALGGTKFDVITKIILPYSFSGIFAGIVLSLGRALGETMAVTMLIGNANKLPLFVFSPGNTIASVIANNFGEANNIQLATLIELGFILMLITSLVNFIGKYIIKKMSVKG